MLDMCFIASDAVLHAYGQIIVLKCVDCQKLYVDTTLTTITSKHIHKYFLCGKIWYESQVVGGNSLTLLGIRIVQQ